MFKYYKEILLALSVLVLGACGGSGDNNTSENSIFSGVFVDSPVKGLRWVTSSMEGTTDSRGTFNYKAGEKISFYVGDILLGDADGSSVIVPIDIVPGATDTSNQAVTNIVRFLLTIDDDGNPDNGIDITDVVSDLTEGKTINFDQSPSDFDQSGEIQTLISTLTTATTAGGRSLVSEEVALDHFNNSLQCIINGSSPWVDDGVTWGGTLNTEVGTTCSNGNEIPAVTTISDEDIMHLNTTYRGSITAPSSGTQFQSYYFSAISTSQYRISLTNFSGEADLNVEVMDVNEGGEVIIDGYYASCIEESYAEQICDVSLIAGSPYMITIRNYSGPAISFDISITLN